MSKKKKTHKQGPQCLIGDHTTDNEYLKAEGFFFGGGDKLKKQRVVTSHFRIFIFRLKGMFGGRILT